jgi:hypothetical protein
MTSTKSVRAGSNGNSRKTKKPVEKLAERITKQVMTAIKTTRAAALSASLETPAEKAERVAEEEARQAAIDPAHVWVKASDRNAAKLRPGLSVSDCEVHFKSGIVVAAEGEEVIYCSIDGEKFRAPIDMVEVPKAGSLGDLSVAGCEVNGEVPMLAKLASAPRLSVAAREFIKPGDRMFCFEDPINSDCEVVIVIAEGAVVRSGAEMCFARWDDLYLGLDDGEEDLMAVPSGAEAAKVDLIPLPHVEVLYSGVAGVAEEIGRDIAAAARQLIGEALEARQIK